MPSGIIMSSGSVGATQEAIEEVLSKNGYESEKPVNDQENPEEHSGEPDEQDETPITTAPEIAEVEEEAEHQAEDKPKLTRKQRAIDRATRELKEENRKLSERLAALEAKKFEAPPAELKEPKREDFKTQQEFEDAHFDFRYKQRRAKEQVEAEQATQKAAQDALKNRMETNWKDYQAAVATFKEEYDDWDEVLNNEPEVLVPQPAYHAIVDLGKRGPAVSYYLGQHPEKRRELWQLTPYEMAFKIKQFADELNGKKASKASTPVGDKPKPKPKLPEPVRPVSTSATTSTLTSREAAQKRDFRAFKIAQRRGV